jgi:hypothetical protein
MSTAKALMPSLRSSENARRRRVNMQTIILRGVG